MGRIQQSGAELAAGDLEGGVELGNLLRWERHDQRHRRSPGGQRREDPQPEDLLTELDPQPEDRFTLPPGAALLDRRSQFGAGSAGERVGSEAK